MVIFPAWLDKSNECCRENRIAMEELIGFLSDPKPEVRLIAASNLLTVDPGQFGETQLRDLTEALSRRLAGAPDFAKVALSLLINLCDREVVADRLLERRVIGSLCALITDAETHEDVVELACMLLANLTRSAAAVAQLLESDSEFAGRRFLSLVGKFVKAPESAEPEGRDALGWMALVLQNCSQEGAARRFLLDKNRALMAHLSMALRTLKSVRRRRGVAATIRNCLLEPAHHSWLVEPPVNLIQSVMICLVSGKGNYDDDEKRAMHPDVREAVFDMDREIERDAETRRLLVESLHALCFHGVIAERIKLWSGYPIMREMERFERSEDVMVEIHTAVDMLLREHQDVVRARLAAAATVTPAAAKKGEKKEAASSSDLQREILQLVEEEKQLTKCAQCGKGEGDATLARCTGCFAVAFCSKKCQTANWKAHKAACFAVQERNKRWDEEAAK
jgi:hypothetical protein